MSARNNNHTAAAATHVHSAECKHEHEAEKDGQQKTADAAASHSHSGSAKGQPCDYCSSVVAHSRVQKLADREAKRDAAAKAHATGSASAASASAADASSCDDSDSDEDEEDKLILPSQRISLPMISPMLRQALLGLFVLGTLRVVRNIARAVLEERRARAPAML